MPLVSLQGRIKRPVQDWLDIFHQHGFRRDFTVNPDTQGLKLPGSDPYAYWLGRCIAREVGLLCCPEGSQREGLAWEMLALEESPKLPAPSSEPDRDLYLEHCKLPFQLIVPGNKPKPHVLHMGQILKDARERTMDINGELWDWSSSNLRKIGIKLQHPTDREKLIILIGLLHVALWAILV